MYEANTLALAAALCPLSWVQEDSHLAAVPEAGQTSGSSAAEQAVSEAIAIEAKKTARPEAGQCNIASAALVVLLLLAGHFTTPSDGRT